MDALDAARAAPWQWLRTRGCYDPAMRTLRPCFTFLALLALSGPAAAAERLPAGFVYLRDVEPSIAQDMRYAGSDNFTGQPLPGYGAAHSAHSTGSAVDLTLIQRPAAPAPPFDRSAAYGSCTGPAAQRAPDNSLDMGTGFDCFDARSHTASAANTPAQMRWRAHLVAAMRAHGFHNYFREWWHFSFGPRGGQAYDFPIVAREAR